MFNRVIILAAGNLPSVKPDFGFPGENILGHLLAILLAGLVLFLIGIFFLCLVHAANAFRQGNEGGVGRNVTGAILTAVVLGIIFTGTTFLNQWATYLTS